MKCNKNDNGINYRNNQKNILYTKINLSDFRQGQNLCNNKNDNINNLNFNKAILTNNQNKQFIYKPRLAFNMMINQQQNDDTQSQQQQQQQQQYQQQHINIKQKKQSSSFQNQQQQQQKDQSQTQSLQRVRRKLFQQNNQLLNHKNFNINHFKQKTNNNHNHHKKHSKNQHRQYQSKNDHNKYHTLSLQQQEHSIIQNQYHKLKLQLQAQITINQSLINQINHIKHQNTLKLKQKQHKIIQKQHQITQLENKIIHLSSHLQKQQKINQNMTKEKTKLIDQIKKLEIIKNKSLVNQNTYLTQRSKQRVNSKTDYNQYYNNNKQNLNINQNYKSSSKDQESMIFNNISIYLNVRINEFKEEIIKSKIKINQKLQDMIDSLLSQIILINPKTVEKVVKKHQRNNSANMSSSFIFNNSKTAQQQENNKNHLISNQALTINQNQQDYQISLSNCQALTPISNRFKDLSVSQNHLNINNTSPINYIEKRYNRFQQEKQKCGTRIDRSSQLAQLQKSKNKLRNMENQFISSSFLSNNCNNNNNHYTHSPMMYKTHNQNLDKSEVSGVDRSRSRRKKIFA